MKSILFIASHRPNRAPGQRFRFEQYFDHLRKNGFECHLSHLLDEEGDKLLYSNGNYLRKAKMLLSHYRQRKQDLKSINNYDIVFIFREALMTRSLFFERQFAHSKAKMVFDFDDAIWKNDTSNANRIFAWMKHPGKISSTIRWSDIVFAGNRYLADYARQFNENVVVIPTTIDTDHYKRPDQHHTQQIVIGWSGSITTIKHFELAIPILRRIRQKYGDKIGFRVIGDSSYVNHELGIKGIAWNAQTEIHELSQFDIGIMPLQDDEWSRGKCGLKGLQYMALEIPALMSPVGVNNEIITHGTNGYLPHDTDEWVECLSLLIENSELRKRIGKNARQTVIDRYSVISQKDIYLQHFQSPVNP